MPWFVLFSLLTLWMTENFVSKLFYWLTFLRFFTQALLLKKIVTGFVKYVYIKKCVLNIVFIKTKYLKTCIKVCRLTRCYFSMYLSINKNVLFSVQNIAEELYFDFMSYLKNSMCTKKTFRKFYFGNQYLN